MVVGINRMIELSFVIPWFTRKELKATLQANAQVFDSATREVIIVNGGNNAALLRSIVSSVSSVRPRVVDISTTLAGTGVNKAAALNIGVHKAQGTKVLLLDADIVLTQELVERAQYLLDDETFIVMDRGVEERPEAHPQTLGQSPYRLREHQTTTILTFANGRQASYEFWQSKNGRSISGLMLLYKKDYLLVEGCNSELRNWGFEDYDLQIRLQAQLGLRRISIGTPLHLTHDFPAGNSMGESEALNTQTAFANYAECNFLGTYSKDVAATAEATEMSRIIDKEIQSQS